MTEIVQAMTLPHAIVATQARRPGGSGRLQCMLTAAQHADVSMETIKRLTITGVVAFRSKGPISMIVCAQTTISDTGVSCARCAIQPEN